MAGIEMDVDIPADVGGDDRVDEDLIDYDEDLIGGDETSPADPVQMDTVPEGGLSPAAEHATAETDDTVITEYPEDADVGQDMTEDNSHINLKAEITGDEGQAMEGSVEVDTVTLDQPNDMENGNAQVEIGDDIHEIDFGAGEPEGDNFPSNPTAHEGDEADGLNGSQYDTAELVASKTDEGDLYETHNQVDEGEHLRTEGDARDAPPEPDVDQRDLEENTVGDGDEIGWEEDANYEERHDDNVTGERQSEEQGENPTNTADVETETEMVESKTEEHVPMASEGDPRDESHFPAITVQYKGEEFPFFSLSSEGFFAEESILDEGIDKVLSGFRDELINEIVAEEEVVFQIDELGLEYSESSPGDPSSHVTLRQILEIYDLLVKNQDPDSSRTLYTYLFTRPSTSKRWESLVESAAAGKGLDEVMHLFESPMPNSATLGDANTAGPFQDPDEYESAEDASGSNENDAQEEALEYDETNDLEEKDAHENKEVNHVGRAEAEVEETEVDDLENQGVYDEVDTELPADALDQPTMTTETHAIAEDSHDPEIETGPEQNVDESDFDVNGDISNELSHQPTDAASGLTDTNTTNTLNNEEQAPEAQNSAEPDLAEPDPAGEGTGEPHDDDDDEIDWHEEPAEDELPPSTSPSASKRPRAEDELDETNEQDFKRQRS